MHFTEDIILEDTRVVLRPLRDSDYEYLLPFAEHEPELWQYSLVSAAGASGLLQYIRQAIEGRNQHLEYPFIVFDKKENSYAGCTRYYDIQLSSHCLQLGYTWYGKAFQRTGLNTHCKYLLLSYAFETLHMERVEFRADNRNLKSIEAMKKIGCTVEGILRSNGNRYDGGRRDSIVLSILKDEWFAELKAKLAQKL